MSATGPNLSHHAHHGHGGGSLRTSVQATLHCLTGCVIGEVVGLAIGVTLGLAHGQRLSWPRRLPISQESPLDLFL